MVLTTYHKVGLLAFLKFLKMIFRLLACLGADEKISTVDTQTLVCKVNKRQQTRYLFSLSLLKAHYKEFCLTLIHISRGMSTTVSLFQFYSSRKSYGTTLGIQAHLRCPPIFQVSVTTISKSIFTGVAVIHNTEE